MRDSFGADLSREYDRERERGDGDRRGDCDRSGAGDGALLTDVGVCDRVRDLPREGDLEAILGRGNAVAAATILVRLATENNLHR